MQLTTRHFYFILRFLNLELFNFFYGHERGHCSFLLHGHGSRLKELFFKMCKTALAVSSKHSKTR